MSTTDPRRDQILTTARDFVARRVPYVWAGTSRDGTDCSGLVQIAYTDAGLSIPRTTWTQEAATQRITADQLEVGDLIFMSFAERCDHVGIYAGDGQMIHEPAEHHVAAQVDLAGYWQGHACSYGRHPDLAEPTGLTPGRAARVDADEGLRLHLEASLRGSVLAVLPDRQLLLTGRVSTTVDGHQWQQVAYFSPQLETFLVGWVAREFLTGG